MQKILKKFSLIILIFLTGCSSTTFIYNRIDFLLPWYLASYVDLSRDQKQYLDEILIPFFSWHRHEELPRYADIINSVEEILDSEVKVENINMQKWVNIIMSINNLFRPTSNTLNIKKLTI